MLILGIMGGKRGGDSIAGYFLANRRLAWYSLSFSMLITTYAPDTPLTVCSLIRKYGISGNWYWWSWIIAYAIIAVIIARLWHRSGVVTDAQLVTLRYGNTKISRFLRFFKALYSGVLINVIILSWVFLAMGKIIKVIVPWHELTGNKVFSFLSSIVPDYITIISGEVTVILMLCLIVVLIYSWVGGLAAVVYTDVLQFFIGVIMGFVVAFFSIDLAGGWSGFVDGISKLRIDYLTPLPGEGRYPLSYFLIAFSVVWWANIFSDGTGYIAQRINASRNEIEATKGVMFFIFLYFILRSIMWIIPGLAMLIIFPVETPASKLAEGALLERDPELGYALLMKIMAERGMAYIVIVGVFAVFMSTVDTHLNWGASYVANDILPYLGFNISERKKILVSKFSIVMFVILGLLISSRLTSIFSMWVIMASLGAGMGLAHLLRWFWWRVSPVTEITGTIASLLSTIIASLYKMDEMNTLLLSGLASGSASILATLLYKPDEHTAREFFEKVRPTGIWFGDKKASYLEAIRYITKCVVLIIAIASILCAIPVLIKLF